jgi:hypothetical protein
MQHQPPTATMMTNPMMTANPPMMRGVYPAQQEFQQQLLQCGTGSGVVGYSNPGVPLPSQQHPLQGQNQLQLQQQNQQEQASVDLAGLSGAGGNFGTYPVGATEPLRQIHEEASSFCSPPPLPQQQQQLQVAPEELGEPHTEPATHDRLSPPEDAVRRVGSGVPATPDALVSTTAASAGGPTKASNILSLAVSTDPRDYSFLPEIQELHSGDHRHHPGGMTAALTASLTSAAALTSSTVQTTAKPHGAMTEAGGGDFKVVGREGASGDSAATATTTMTMISPNADSTCAHDSTGVGQGTGSIASGVSAAIASAAAVAAGDTGKGEGGAGVGFFDGISGGPFANIDQHTQRSGQLVARPVVAGGPSFPLSHPLSAGHSHQVGMYQQTIQDPYAAMMMHQSLQQQQSAPLMMQYQLGCNDPMAQQQLHQHAMLSQMTSRQHHEHVSHLKRRNSSDSISSDDHHSDAGEVDPHRSISSQQHLSSHPPSTIHRLEAGASMSFLNAERAALPQQQQQQQQLILPSHSNPHPQLTSALPLGMSAATMGLFPQQQLQQQLLLTSQQQQHLYSPQQVFYGGGIPMHLEQQVYPSASLSANFASIGGGCGYSQIVPQNEVPAVTARTDVGEGQVDRKEKKRRTKSFPEKLMSSMMKHAVDESAVAWLPDGKSFVVVSSELFVQQILRPAFKECKYSSFVRKLHRWGFVRMTSGTGTDCFHHPLFQNGRMDLVSKLSCAPREKERAMRGMARGWKPPSLAGVERFVRAKAEAAHAASESERDTEHASSLVLDPKEGFGRTGVGHPSGEVAAPSVIPSTIEEDEEEEDDDHDDETDTIACTRPIYRQ